MSASGHCLTSGRLCRQVETIGDAYMVVGGIPTRAADHATRVVSQAIDMVRLAREVAHPITGDPVQVSAVFVCRYVGVFTFLSNPHTAWRLPLDACI